MNRSYSKIRHIKKSNIKLEKRMINEQVNVDSVIDTIKNNLSTIVGVITSFFPVLTIPKLIYFIVSGGPQELLKQLETYKSKIETELKKRNIQITVQDIVNNIEEIKDEFISELKKRVK